LSQLTFVFRSCPHTTSAGREGVDALLAASAYSEEISVIFLGDGVGHLLSMQNPSEIQSKDYAPMFKLFDLYDIEQVFVCQHSLQERGLDGAALLIQAQVLNVEAVQQQLGMATKILTF